MIIDDDHVLTASLSRLLAGGDLAVATFGSVEEAEVWIAREGAPDVVIADHQLPGRGGLDFLLALGEQRPTVARILHTGEANVADMLTNADFPVLLKPVAPYRLRQVVNRALGREMPWPW